MVDYTMEQLRTSLVAIIGERRLEIHRDSTWGTIGKTPEVNFPRALDDAAMHCFMTQRPEDEHSALVRHALFELSETGELSGWQRA